MTPKEIKAIVEGCLGIKIDTINKRRSQVAGRRIYMKLCVDYTKDNYTSIGSYINRDHSTISHCLNSFDNFITADSRFSKWYYDCNLLLLTEISRRDIISTDSVEGMMKENERLRARIKTMTLLDNKSTRLVSIFNSLPGSLQDDVMFKVETAYKINEKHKRDLTVIYTDA